MFDRLKITLYKIVFISILIAISTLYIKIVFHDIYMGTDELRTTYVAKEIADRGNVYYTDLNNTTYNTNIFVKTGFFINDSKVIYPIGFTINSLILVPILSLTHGNTHIFNIFALICFILSYLMIYQIFSKLGLNASISLLGSVIFSTTNYNLAMYVAYFPDFLLQLLVLIFINIVINFNISRKLSYLYLISFLSPFLLAYKVTMYPVLFTFIPLYLLFLIKHKQITTNHVFKFSIIFIIAFCIFNFPQYLTSTIGEPYGNLIGSNKSTQSNSNLITQGNSIDSFVYTTEHLTTKFYSDFLVPKENGKWLIWHLNNNFTFFSSNNIIVLFGLLVSTVYLFKVNRWLFTAVILIFITSFLLWGNMSFYGGGVPNLSNLWNSHTRYMLPVIILFYILGFFYISKIAKKQYLLIILLICIFTRTCISFTKDYPFAQYSLVNKTGFVYDYYREKESIINLHIPKNSIFVSATFDDYDLSYYFNNYANLKLLANNPVEMRSIIDRFVNDKTKNVYFLFPWSDSRFNPISRQELNSIYQYIESTFSYKVVLEGRRKQLLLLSRKG